MSSLSIAAYFPWNRVVIAGQNVSSEVDLAVVDVRPDRRFAPLCSRCSQPASRVVSEEVRAVRDLNFASASVHLRLSYRKVYCPACRAVIVEELEAVDRWQRVTRRLARSVHDLCKRMTVSDVADHFGLGWKTVKNIDKNFLEEHYDETDCAGLRLLAVDEIAVRKGHKYMTVVIDYETGRVVWMGEGRTRETLSAFFAQMTEEQKVGIEAVAMDMWEPYIQAVGDALPNAKIVFDLFHVVAAYGKVIDRVRNSEMSKATLSQRALIRGTKYLLLKRHVTDPDERERLRKLLQANETLSTVYILKEMLVRIWRYRSRAWAARALAEWCALARMVPHPEPSRFARTLERYRQGILNHCEFPIHNSKLEGVNNKIKVIKRRAYGYHDDRYFVLKVKQAFDPESDVLFRR